MPQTLVVKASNADMAKEFAEKKGFTVLETPLDTGREQYKVSVIVNVERACKWFMEGDWTSTPYPHGTLLWYSS